MKPRWRLSVGLYACLSVCLLVRRFVCRSVCPLVCLSLLSQRRQNRFSSNDAQSEQPWTKNKTNEIIIDENQHGKISWKANSQSKQRKSGGRKPNKSNILAGGRPPEEASRSRREVDEQKQDRGGRETNKAMCLLVVFLPYRPINKGGRPQEYDSRREEDQKENNSRREDPEEDQKKTIRGGRETKRRQFEEGGSGGRPKEDDSRREGDQKKTIRGGRETARRRFEEGGRPIEPTSK